MKCRQISYMPRLASTSQRFRVLAACLGVALLVGLIFRTGTATVLNHAEAVGSGMLLILALGGISHLLRTYAWRLTFHSDIRGVSVANTFALRLISEAIGTFGLAGQVVGDTMRVSLLGPAVPVADRISSVALDRGIYMMTAAIVSVVGIGASVLLLPLPGIWRSCALVFAASLVVLLVLTVVSFARQWRVLSTVTRSIRRPQWLRQWLANKAAIIESVEDHLLTFHSQAPRSFWGAQFLCLSSQVLAIAEVYLLLRFMGFRITLLGPLVIEAFTKLISVVGALNPGNIGTFEGGNLLLAHLLGFSGAAGLTLALCRRARTLFWAGIGALCLMVLSRKKEQSKPEAGERPGSGDTAKSQRAGEIYAKAMYPTAAPAVIIVVEPNENGNAVARIGGLPVLLRAVLTAQLLQPSRIVLSVPSSNAQALVDQMRRTGRLPESVEWHERRQGTSMSSIVGDVAATADRIVLLSGTMIYKPALVSMLGDGKKATDVVVFKTGFDPVGLCCLTKSAALQVAQQTNADSVEDLQTWVEANCNATIAPASPEDWQAIRTPEDRATGNHKLDGWLVKPTDGRFAQFNRRISIPISRQLIKTPITPNVVTFIILAVSVAAAAFFARGGYWNMLMGAFLSVWASILDGGDGEVARFKLQSSPLGCWLDTICDYLYYLMTFAGIAYGLNRASHSHIYLTSGAVLVTGMLLCFWVVSWLRRRMAAERPENFLSLFQSRAEARSSNPLLFVARNTEFIIRRCFFPYALLVAAGLNMINVVFIVTAISANLVWSIALYSLFAFSRKENAFHLMDARMQPSAGMQAPS